MVELELGGGFGIGRVERGRLIEVAVPGARVTLSRPGADGEEPLSGRTNAEGDFLFCGIPFGPTVTLTPDFPGTQGATETVEPAGAVGAVRDLSLQMPDAGGLEGNPLEIRVERTGVGEPAGAARVVGRVVDHADGDPVVGATIRLVEAEPVLTTDADGRFVFGNVAPGTYELEVEHVGYGTQRQTFELEGGPVVELPVRIPSRPIALE
ncbi:MAG: carboxypeptidase regulatory-like domain-containing protein, partial [Longimicrobiales bacterium]